MPGITKIGVSNVAGGTLANGQVSNVKINGASVNVKGDGPHVAHGIGIHATPFSTVGSSSSVKPPSRVSINNFNYIFLY